LLVTLLLAALAYWGPWIDHRAAALKLSGQDMGEFVKFIPEIRMGQTRFPRQLFYLPPFCCTICLVLLAINKQMVYPRWLRVAMLAFSGLLLSGLLPPAWGHPSDLFTAEFRLQGIALVLGLVLVLAHGMFRQVPLPVLGIVLEVLAIGALLPAQWAFWAIRPRIWAVYDTPTIRLGWGLWLDIASWVGVIASAGVLLRKRRELRDV
jgi:hypothetical protein